MTFPHADSSASRACSAESRLQKEAAFHDAQVAQDTRADADKFWQIAKASSEFYRARALEGVRGAKVLEYGCGTGSAAFDIAKLGGHTTGIDISPGSILVAKRRAEELEVTDGTEFTVMNAEALEFPDSSFDRVCGSGILHHLDLARALPEIARVLRPGGHAVFSEPMGHNPLINAYRRRTPHMRTEDEHPLVRKDIEDARRQFRAVQTHYFHLAALGAVPLRKTRVFHRVNSMLDRIDQILLSQRSPLRWQAWFVVLEFDA